MSRLGGAGEDQRVVEVTEPASPRAYWLRLAPILAVCVLATIVGQFYRNAHVVVAPDIMRDIGISAQLFGYMSGILFVTAAIAQIPAGILIDAYGPRKTIPAMLALAAAGGFLFAAAGRAAGLLGGRFVVGLGVASVAMAGIVVCTRWMPRRYFASVAGLIVGLSHLGNLSATAPMAWVSTLIGWRMAYVGMGAFSIALALVAWLMLRDAPPGHPYARREAETLMETARGVIEVLSLPGIFRLLAMAGTAFASISCILGLWGGPYLHDVHGLDAVARGWIMLIFAASLVVGNIAMGFFDQRIAARKRFVLSAGTITAASFLALSAFPEQPLWCVALLYALIGLVGGYMVLIIAHGRAFYPDRLLGRGVTIVNCAVLAGAGFMQGLTGAVVGLIAPGATDLPVHAYRVVFAVVALVLVLALLVYRKCPEGAAGPQG